MKRLILAGLAALAASALLAGPAFAWHANVSGSADCTQTTVTVTVPDEDWVTDDTTASGSVSLAGQSKPWQVDGAGSASVAFPGVNGGPATVTGSFNTGESAGGSVDIAAVADCEQAPPEEETPPTTAPPTTAPPTTGPPVSTPTPIAGHSTSKTRTPAKKRAPADSTPRPNYTPPEFDGSDGATPFAG